MSRWRLFGSVCLTLLLTLAGPGAQALILDLPGPEAGSPAAETDGSRRLPSQWTSDARPALAELAEARGSRLTPRELVSLQARLLAAEAGAPPELMFPSRAGDLDGDGGNDVITFEWPKFDGDAVMSARRGTDGSVLWTAAGIPFAQPADLDGDGTVEILTVSYGWTPLAAGVRLLTQQISLLRGSDGTPVWSTPIVGADYREGDMKQGQGSDVQFVASLRVMPDATGDGRPDVWVGTVNAAWEHGGFNVSADSFVGRTLEGTTGLEVGRVVAVGQVALPWAIPVEDLSGDGMADAISLSGRYVDVGILSAHSALGTPWWVREVPTAMAFLSSGDLDGDGVPEAVLQAFDDEAALRIAYRGTDGSEMWSHPDNGYIDFAGDIDGDGGTDLIQLATYDSGMRVTAWSGATGEVAWGPVEYPAAPGAWVMFCFCVHDVTGDGIWDPLIGDLDFSTWDVMVRMLDGTSGLQLWERLLGPGEGLPVPIGADADGDAIEDVGYSTPGGVALRRGYDLSVLWSIAGDPEKMVIGFYGDDLVGDDRAEIVTARWEFTEDAMIGSAAADSRDGRVWATS